MKKSRIIISLVLILGLVQLFSSEFELHADETESKMVTFHSTYETGLQIKELPDPIPRFTFNSGLHFEYPDAVRGIYVTGHSAGGSRFEDLIEFINDTPLNSMVIDVKDDYGKITYKLPEDLYGHEFSESYIDDPRAMLERLEEEGIYPIARVVVFKDSELAKSKPEWSFLEDGEVWVNGRGEAFVNPFVQDVWEYNIDIAKHAVELGFQEIQLDYVRFPEGFETRDEMLDYTRGDYEDAGLDNVRERVTAVNEFVEYSYNELEPYGVDVSVDIFGYAATVEDAPGIGQNFLGISENVDVISSMIYPSHWTPYFGIDEPDREPYNVVNEYSQVENELLAELDDPPVSRPWLQDFTASWLYSSGNVFTYGPDEVTAQIQALYDNDIYEYLLWDPSNRYTRDANFDPR
ncbi:putative glycoside hydrolase [Alkalibacillus haloalkaliphilus]|uniref:putative glycoside hydrolase n=1 Tax=Alkalibacillus haloalkaliphilus TaxID=94136 RepID=UPI0029369D79|nr:putative glycoside hydrolase [Alkalibacillus haloalkaliphilus]MDV2582704.1 putative glycoside hydrolase [Alkalibacillus haloalkaliphilus]